MNGRITGETWTLSEKVTGKATGKGNENLHGACSEVEAIASVKESEKVFRVCR